MLSLLQTLPRSRVEHQQAATGFRQRPLHRAIQLAFWCGSASVFPASAACYLNGLTVSASQTFADTCSLTGTLTVAPTGVLTNTGTVDNFGGIVNDGRIKNTGVLAMQGKLSGPGRFNNTGTLKVLARGNAQVQQSDNLVEQGAGAGTALVGGTDPATEVPDEAVFCQAQEVSGREHRRRHHAVHRCS